MKAVVSDKGQVTIPKRLRDRLGIEAGQELEFTSEEGRLIARKVQRRSPVDAVYGMLELPDGDSDAFLDEVRGPAELL